ncbi:MAG TPA: MFS transporter [Thermodesulfobacteriota bacterium]|nr:MFS transporter [Thermodesulfobacteriota bacterium]
MYYGYVIVTAASIMMMMIWGTFNSFGVFFEPFIKEFGWTRAVTSGASALNTMIFGILCVFSAGLSERLGPRWVMTVCGVILGLGYFLMARLTSMRDLYLSFGVVVGIGMSPYIPLLSLVPRWFTTNRGRMNAIVLSGMGLGIMLVPPIASTLISLWQWRNSYLVIAIATLIVTVAASQFLKVPSRPALEDEKRGSAAPWAERRNEGLSFQQAIRTREFVLLCWLYFSFLFCLVSITVHIVIHAIGLDIPATHAALTLSLIGGACIVGMNVMGNVADRFSNKMALGVSYSLMGCSLVWVIPSHSEWSLYLFSTAFGFAYGGMQVLFSPLVAEFFGTRSHGVILATGALVGSIGAAIGPIIAGYIFDTSGSYTVAFILCAILAFTGLASTFLLQKKPFG